MQISRIYNWNLLWNKTHQNATSDTNQDTLSALDTAAKPNTAAKHSTQLLNAYFFNEIWMVHMRSHISWASATINADIITREVAVIKTRLESVRFQGMRVAYFFLDCDGTDDRIIMNRIVSLVEDAKKEPQLFHWVCCAVGCQPMLLLLEHIWCAIHAHSSEYMAVSVESSKSNWWTVKAAKYWQKDYSG